MNRPLGTSLKHWPCNVQIEVKPRYPKQANTRWLRFRALACHQVGHLERRDERAKSCCSAGAHRLRLHEPECGPHSPVLYLWSERSSSHKAVMFCDFRRSCSVSVRRHIEAALLRDSLLYVVLSVCRTEVDRSCIRRLTGRQTTLSRAAVPN